MLAQKNANKKSLGNTLMNLLLKENKKTNLDPQTSSLVRLVDNMNITQEKKDKIKSLTLQYINSDDILEKNKSINELKKYSKNEECKENMDNYLMYLRMQDDIKYLERNNTWNNIWIVTMTLFLIIIMIACIFSVGITHASAFYPALFLAVFLIYMYARFFPEIKITFTELKKKLYKFFQKKK
ncbi:hypothetical protein PFFCH_05517 [Plasmodium falciparum FCH/4]|nr:hypothetical protein PFFCH_05517 [Plasmodium falciparum FCH/4]